MEGLRPAMRSYFMSIILLILLCSQSINAHAVQFISVNDKKTMNLKELVTKLEEADVIFVGEVHDNVEHHKTQLDILRSLFEEDDNIAIGLEMFTTDSQQYLDYWMAGKVNEESFISVYSINWSFDWRLSRELMVFAKDNHIPLIALNVPKAVISKVMTQGSSVLQASDLPPNFSWSLNSPQSAYIEKIAQQVFGGSPPPKLLARLSDAQALRNNWMAWTLAKYKEKNEAIKIVVLSGTYHAVKNGVPELLSNYGKIKYKVILPELPEFNIVNTSMDEADYLIVK